MGSKRVSDGTVSAAQAKSTRALLDAYDKAGDANKNVVATAVLALMNQGQLCPALQERVAELEEENRRLRKTALPTKAVPEIRGDVPPEVLDEYGY